MRNRIRIAVDGPSGAERAPLQKLWRRDFLLIISIPVLCTGL